MKTFTRNAGRRGSRATSAAAYRAGERIRDARTGTAYDHRHRNDVLHKEIVLPRELAARGPQMDWARDRARLWNAAEHAETHRNARVAREFTIALPHELDGPARVRLAQTYAHTLAERYRNAVDLVIHAPRGDARNFHAHLLTTTRELTPDGLGRKAALELSGTERHRRGLVRWADERSWLREHWAEVTNQALREAGLQLQISHLPSPTRDLTRPPRLPLAAYHMEREGRRSFLAERIRARHAAQLQRAQTLGAERSGTYDAPGLTWLQRAHAHAQAAWHSLRDAMQFPRQLEAERMRAADPGRGVEAIGDAAPHSPVPTPPEPDRSASQHRMDDLQLEARRAWLEYRQRSASQAAAIAIPGQQRNHEHQLGVEPELPGPPGNDYDLGL
jgi:hypothetical protein